MRRRIVTMAWSNTLASECGWRAWPLAAIVAIGATALDASAQTATDAKSKTPATAASTGDSGLSARVQSLEEQLVDMQVVIGTLESLAKSGGATSQPAFRSNGGADAQRIDNLEAQIRQLSTQVQALSDQLRNSSAPLRRSDASDGAPSSIGGGFGATTVTPNSGEDAIGGLLAESPPPSAGAAGAASQDPSSVATGALGLTDGVEPKQLYETAYGYLLQRDYGAAQAAFDDFLQRFPTDSLAGNAQYWLGESHFVRGQYKAAAGAFLKGYQTYAQSQKAPDSLLKLAMSLDRLGQKDAACSSFSELNVKFPNAAQSIKARAQSERQRVGCG
jgi:tol-pal system protein YbgF